MKDVVDGLANIGEKITPGQPTPIRGAENMNTGEDRVVPGIVVEGLASAVELSRVWLHDYRQCVIDKAVADRGCETWEQTVDRLIMFARIKRDMEIACQGMYCDLATRVVRHRLDS